MRSNVVNTLLLVNGVAWKRSEVGGASTRCHAAIAQFKKDSGERERGVDGRDVWKNPTDILSKVNTSQSAHARGLAMKL